MILACKARMIARYTPRFMLFIHATISMRPCLKMDGGAGQCGLMKPKPGGISEETSDHSKSRDTCYLAAGSSLILEPQRIHYRNMAEMKIRLLEKTRYATPPSFWSADLFNAGQHVCPITLSTERATSIDHFQKKLTR